MATTPLGAYRTPPTGRLTVTSPLDVALFRIRGVRPECGTGDQAPPPSGTLHLNAEMRGRAMTHYPTGIEKIAVAASLPWLTRTLKLRESLVRDRGVPAIVPVFLLSVSPLGSVEEVQRQI